jgi:hypothetical protein
MKKINFFNRHLNQTGENYFEHFLFAFSAAIWIGAVSIFLFCHAIFPFAFTLTASSNIKKINEVMQKRLAMLLARRQENDQNQSN